MRIIYPDQIITLTADEENASYPATNLENEHPKKVWKATSRDAIITVTVGAGSNAIAVFATNALSIGVSVAEGENSIEWDTGIEWDTDIEWFENSGAGVEYTLYDLTTSNEGALWANYTERNVIHTITLTLTAAIGATLEAGVVTAGESHLFVDPEYGIQEGLNDYSIVKKLSNGAFYVKAMDVARTFAGQLTVERDSDFYAFMLDIARDISTHPFACRVSTNLTNWEWVVYVRFDSKPGGTHAYPVHSEIQFSLLEVL